MKFFVASSSKATASFADRAKCPRIKHFSGNKVIQRCVVPENYIHNFYEADVIIVNGTWGSDLRKKTYLEGYDDDKFVDGYIPDIEYEGNIIPYLNRSATLDYINTELVRMAKEQNKPVVVFESSTVSRAEANYSTDFSLKDHARVGLDSWTYGEGKWLHTDDFESLQDVNAPRLYDHTWKHDKDNGAIYIFTGFEMDPTSTKHPRDFLLETVKKIRRKTNRRICIKVHPISNLQNSAKKLLKTYKDIHIVGKNVPIQNFYQDMYCAVIDNSTSVFELIDAGIPTFCSKINFGSELLNTDIENIRDPYLASKKEVLDWTKKMSCTELHKDIILSDDIVTYVEKLVRRHRDGF
jgi:hypothetical protein